PGSYNATIIATAGHISHTLTVSMNILAQEAVNAIQNGDFSNGLAYWTTGTIYGVQYNGNYPIIQVTTSTGPCTPGALQGSSFLDIWNTLGTSGYADESFTVPQAGGVLAFLTMGTDNERVRVSHGYCYRQWNRGAVRYFRPCADCQQHGRVYG